MYPHSSIHNLVSEHMKPIYDMLLEKKNEVLIRSFAESKFLGCVLRKQKIW